MGHQGHTAAGGRVWRTLAACLAALAAVPASCHAAPGGAVAAWGENFHAQLDAGYRDTFEESPVPALGLSGVTALAAGNGSNLALLGDGTVRAWGGNLWGQLGDGTRTGTWQKEVGYVAVSGLSGVRAIAAANAHDMALLQDGTVMAWGNNYYGQLGDGKGGIDGHTGALQTRPQSVGGLGDVLAIAAGGGSDFALLADHTVMAWGRNDAGQLGIGEIGPETCLDETGARVPCSTVPRPVGTPVVNERGEAEVRPLEGVAAISAGAEAAYALLESHRVMAWGDDERGQLGTGGEPVRAEPAPQQVIDASTGAPLSGVVAVAGGRHHALALLSDGLLVGWGESEHGELGAVAAAQCQRKVTCVTAATPVAGLAGVTAVAAGSGYSLAVSGGRTYSFGKNRRGELGDGGTAPSDVPSPIPGLGAVSALAAGNTHALALLAPGVQPPAAALSVQPGLGTLSVSWTVRAREYRLSVRVSRASRTAEERHRLSGRPIERVKLGGRESLFAFTGLQAQPYEVIVLARQRRGRSKRRVLAATPLP